MKNVYPLQFVPFVSIGPIPIGKPTDLSALKVNFDRVIEKPDGFTIGDAEIVIDLDCDRCCDLVAVYPEGQVLVRGHSVLGLSENQFLAAMRKAGIELVSEDETWCSKDRSFAVRIDSDDDTVCVFTAYSLQSVQRFDEKYG